MTMPAASYTLSVGWYKTSARSRSINASGAANWYDCVFHVDVLAQSGNAGMTIHHQTSSLLHRAAVITLVGMAAAVFCGLLFTWLGEEVLEGDTEHFDAHVRALVHRESQTDRKQAMIIDTEVGTTRTRVILTI
mgnify:CR=1 FL=1